jgi:glycosyltransferase involved in cell wall biosynthesis
MDLGLSNRVIFEGSVIPEKIVNYYRDADIFINLSSTGSLDKVVLESMASGNKILTSNEAFSSILPKENLTSNDPRIIADSIRYLFNAPKNESLRKIILSHHELGNLVDNLSKSIMK